MTEVAESKPDAGKGDTPGSLRQQQQAKKAAKDQQQQPPQLSPPHHKSKYYLIHNLRERLSDEDVLDYAGFLQSRERMCCPDGYVDSRKLVYQYQLHSPNFSVDQIRPEGARAPAASQSKLITLSMNRERFEKDYLVKLKKAEELIAQSKQSERVAKRHDGDILKDQREIRIARREFGRENDKQQQQENQRLDKGMERYTEIKRDYHHRKATLVHQRMQEALLEREDNLNTGRKTMNRSLSLARQYRAKMDSLQLKRLEVDRLMADYEKRLRLKREQEEALARELHQLGSDLGMEAMKARALSLRQLEQRKLGEREKVTLDREEEQSVDEQLTHGSEDQKSSVMHQRRLSAELARRNDQLDMKKRQDDRALIDTRTALDDSTRDQRDLSLELELCDTDRKRAQMEHKVAEVRQRRHHLARDSLAERLSHAEESEAFYSARAEQRARAAQIGQHEDALRHFQRVVSKLDDEESALYQRVRAMEAERQDEEQKVRRLQSRLQRARSQNESESLARLSEENARERQLAEKLQRHRSRLESLTVEREEAYLKLEAKRQELVRDKDTLETERRERDRLAAIGDKK